MNTIFWGIFSTLAGAVAGALISTWATHRTVKKQQFYVESAKFRAAFVDEMIRLRHEEDDVCKILNTLSIAKHEKAKILFYPWVSVCKRESFNKAWEDHVRIVKTTAPGSFDTRKTECYSATRRIEKLLLHAKI